MQQPVCFVAETLVAFFVLSFVVGQARFLLSCGDGCCVHLEMGVYRNGEGGSMDKFISFLILFLFA